MLILVKTTIVTGGLGENHSTQTKHSRLDFGHLEAGGSMSGEASAAMEVDSAFPSPELPENEEQRLNYA